MNREFDQSDREEHIQFYFDCLHRGEFDRVWQTRRHLISILNNEYDVWYTLSDAEERLEIINTAIARFRNRQRKRGA